MHRHHKRTDLVRPTLSYVRSLQTRRRTRDRNGAYWLEGVRQFVHACDAGIRLHTILRSPILLKSDLCDRLVRTAAAKGVRVLDVTPEQFRGVSLLERASGIAAIVEQHWSPLQSLEPRGQLGWLVVESLRSAGNLGTILRTAEAAGMAGMIFLSTSNDPFDPAVVRASMGGIFHLKLVRTDVTSYRRWATAQGVTTVGLSPRAETVWTRGVLDGPVALLLGDERKGLSEAAQSLCDRTTRLPMTGTADSLNVAVAAGVMMYELVRRQTCVDDNRDERSSSRCPASDHLFQK